MSEAFDNFLENLYFHGLEYFKKYYGVYRATVTRNDDPQSRGRIQARCPDVGQTVEAHVWIDPIFAGAGKDRGAFWPPEVGDSVRVVFTAGNPSKPEAYWGGWFGTTDLPSEFDPSAGSPERRGFITRGGHSLVFDDTDGEQSLEITWHKPTTIPEDRSETPPRTGEKATLRFTDSGIVLEFKDDQKIEIIDGRITLDVANVVLVSADQKAVRGDELVRYLNGHTHGTAWGPSSPPLVPVPPTALSSKVKLK